MFYQELPSLENPVANETPIRLRNRVFTPTPDVSLATGKTRLDGYVIVQFNTLPDAEDLAEMGLQPLAYVPDNAIVVSASSNLGSDDLKGVRWIGRLEPTDKIAGNVAQLFLEKQEASVLVEAFSDTSREELAAIINAAGGYADSHPDLPAQMLVATGSLNMVETLAQASQTAWINPAPDVLLHTDRRFTYCQGKATAYGYKASFAVAGPGWDGPGHGSANLTFRLLNITGTARQAILDAMADWREHAMLEFTETTAVGANRSLEFSIETGAHGHLDPDLHFDGIYGILAHGFQPSRFVEPMAGDVHFDAIDFGRVDEYSLALHETGHALDLDHSDDPGAAMHAFLSENNIESLNNDDIQAIQSIYAPRIDPSTIRPSWRVEAACCKRVFTEITPVAGATSYQIYQSSLPYSNYAYYTGSTTSTSPVVRVENGSPSYLWIKAVVAGQHTQFSNVIVY